MFKKIAILFILSLFVLQINHLLFASDNIDTKEEASTVAEEKVNAKTEKITPVAAAETETEIEIEAETETVEETENITKSAEEKGAGVEEKAEDTTMSVVEAETEIKEKTQESTEPVATEGTKAEVETEDDTKTAADTEASAEKSKEPVVEAKLKPEASAGTVEGKETDIIVTVNGEDVLRKDFDRRLNVFRRMNQDVTRAVKMQVVNQLTKKILLKQFIEKQDFSVSKEEIQGELEKIKLFLQNNPNNADKPLEEILQAQGSSISELESEVSRTLSLSKYLDKVVSEADKINYFNANKDAFNGARVKASHVLIDTRNMKKEAEFEEAKKMIEIVKAEIDKGADFAQMAKKYSDCPSAEKGGDIGFFQRKGSIVEEFAEVAFSMDVGEVSEPVKTQFGYHIIKVTEKEEGKDVSYEDVADMVDFVYMQIKTEELLKDLYDKAEIKILL